jgi:4-amino-4-deoxy-L-arabinose transferase-like glycosyltransferase
LAIAGVLVVGAALRLSTLGLQSYWSDEAATVRLLRGGIGQAVREAADSEATPPLYYGLAWVWSKAFGTGEVGLRLLSALLGTATILVVYVAGRRLASARVGLGAAAFVAVSPIFVWYSQEARAYALLGLLVALSFLFFAETARASSRRAPVLWVATSLLAVLTHWFAVFVVGAEALWLLVKAFDRREVRLAVVAVGAGGAALAPLAFHQLAHTTREAAGAPLSHFPRVPGQLIIGYGVSPLQVVLGVAATALLLATFWLALRRATGAERDLGVLAGAVAAAAAVAAFVLAFGGVNLVTAAHLQLILVPLALVIGVGLGAGKASREGPLVGLALCAVLAAATVDVFADPELQREDYRSAARALGPPARSRVIVLNVDPRGLYPYVGDAKTLPARGRPVSEIDLVGISSPLSSARSLPRPRRPIRPPAPGFVLTEVRESSTYTLVRFRSSAPRLVTPELVRPAGLTAASEPVYQAEEP